jgi:alpha-amylase
MKRLLLFISFMTFFSCVKTSPEKKSTEKKNEKIFIWEGANIYFLLTDRFNNGDTTNDINFDRTKKTAKLRGFQGGDIKGITQKINEGYFTELGINAIWLTPIVEQIHGAIDEGTGLSYGFHGYWASDWTRLDPNVGTREELKELVDTAHENGIRIVLDAVINHTGPVTKKDQVWPKDWVRTAPQCTYENYQSTVRCTLVKNLPDIKTESNENVLLPKHLVEKWKAEGRYEQELLELNEFFIRTGYPRAPRFYIIKWLTDYITEFGIDGYRVDTVKHTEEFVWQELRKECDIAFATYKKNNREEVLDDNGFYLVGEVYNYGISAGKSFDFGDKKVNYFENAFNSLINFELKWDAAQQDYESVFKQYSAILNSNLKGYGVLNYLSSHDDGQPFDPMREKTFETATRLLLTPGASQVFYGDESARSLVVEGTNGDATLRSNMNWEAIKKDKNTQEILKHWQKLGKFRADHPAIGAGVHHMISEAPYVFSRTFSKESFSDKVVVGLELSKGEKEIRIGNVFAEKEELKEVYSGEIVTVHKGKVMVDSKFTIVLLEKNR